MIYAEDFLERGSTKRSELQERPMGSSLTCHFLAVYSVDACSALDWLIAAAAQPDDMARDLALTVLMFVWFVCLYPPRVDD